MILQWLHRKICLPSFLHTSSSICIKSLILVFRIHFSFIFSEHIEFEPYPEVISGASFTQTLTLTRLGTEYSRKLTFLWASLLGFASTLRPASLFGAGAGAGAHALLNASSLGGTSGTSASPGALSTGPVTSSLGLPSHPGWRPLALAPGTGAPSTGVSQALALFVALSRAVVSRAMALFSALLQSVSIRPLALLCCAVLKVTIQKASFFPESINNSLRIAAPSPDNPIGPLV